MSLIISALQDADKCVNANCPYYNFMYGYAAHCETGYNTILEWSDGGAGGQFGYIDANTNQFTPATDPMQVTHYKAPSTPGIVNLTVTVDDPLQHHDANGNLFTTADDAPATSGPSKLTVWDYTIDDAAASFIPSVGVTVDHPQGTTTPTYTLTPSQVTFTAKLRPTADHNGQPMTGTMTFNLASSTLQGFCNNAGAQTDADLKFHPDQTGLSITDTTATTTEAVNQQQVSVDCYDYGAYGTLNASIQGAFGNGSARLEGTQNFGAQIPKDANGNHIADAAPQDSTTIGGQTSCGADDDNDPKVVGATNGDGLTRFEEYRGFMAAGTHLRTDVLKRDLFICYGDPSDDNDFTEGWGYATDLETADSIILHRIYTSEMTSDRVINSNSDNRQYISCPGGALKMAQKAVCLIKDTTVQPYYGFTNQEHEKPAPNLTPNCAGSCIICVATISKACTDAGFDTQYVTAGISKVIAHEIGHAAGMEDRPSPYWHEDNNPITIMCQGFRTQDIGGIWHWFWNEMPTTYHAADRAITQLRH